MSYTQIEIGGKLRGLKFNQEALELFVKHIDWLNQTAASEVYAGFYGGLVANARVKREEVDFNFENVCDWVDELTPEVKAEAMKVMSETQKYKEWLSSFQEKIRTLVKTETDKKKAPLKQKKK